MVVSLAILSGIGSKPRSCAMFYGTEIERAREDNVRGNAADASWKL